MGRLSSIALGIVTAIGGFMGAWLRSHVLGLGPDVQPIQVPWGRVTRIDVTVHIDMDREDDGFTRSEQAVWDRWISHMPWANR